MTHCIRWGSSFPTAGRGSMRPLPNYFGPLLTLQYQFCQYYWQYFLYIVWVSAWLFISKYCIALVLLVIFFRHFPAFNTQYLHGYIDSIRCGLLRAMIPASVSKHSWTDGSTACTWGGDTGDARNIVIHAATTPMGISPPATRLSPYSAQAAAGRLTTCKVTAGHTLVLHRRHTPITTLPDSETARAEPIEALQRKITVFRPSPEFFGA